MFRWDSPGGAQTHESAAGTRRTINPTLPANWPGWFHTHINLPGPLQPASGCCSSSTPSPVLRSVGLPLSGAQGPCIHRGPDYICVFTFWVMISWGFGSFQVWLPGWGPSPETCWGTVQAVEDLNVEQFTVLNIVTWNNRLKQYLSTCRQTCFFGSLLPSSSSTLNVSQSSALFWPFGWLENTAGGVTFCLAQV